MAGRGRGGRGRGGGASPAPPAPPVPPAVPPAPPVVAPPPAWTFRSLDIPTTKRHIIEYGNCGRKGVSPLAMDVLGHTHDPAAQRQCFPLSLYPNQLAMRIFSALPAATPIIAAIFAALDRCAVHSPRPPGESREHHAGTETRNSLFPWSTAQVWMPYWIYHSPRGHEQLRWQLLFLKQDWWEWLSAV